MLGPEMNAGLDIGPIQKMWGAGPEFGGKVDVSSTFSYLCSISKQRIIPMHSRLSRKTISVEFTFFAPGPRNFGLFLEIIKCCQYM